MFQLVLLSRVDDYVANKWLLSSSVVSLTARLCNSTVHCGSVTSIIGNHPLLGGAKLMGDCSLNDRGGFIKLNEQLITVVYVASGDKNY